MDETLEQTEREINGGFILSVLDGISDSIKIIDKSFNVVYTNKTGLGVAGKETLKEIKTNAKCFEEFYHNESVCSFCVADQVFRTGEPAYNVIRGKDGRGAIAKELSAFPLKDKKGEVEYAIEIVRDVTRLKRDLTADTEFANIISEDPSMKEIFEVIKSVAPTNTTVLITGETGTGKELIARAIHQSSKRAGQRMVTINCGALPDTLLETELFGHEKGAFTGAEKLRIGKFELADKGTLFLDEIGTISTAMQVKILRALQEGEITRVGGNDPVKVNVRFICATNLDLKEEVDSGEFREDLYYRINVMPIHLPPLRDRGGDIKLLAEHYLEKFSREIGKNLRGFTTPAVNQMRRYAWPGNIRELRNLIERAVILSKGEMVEKIDIPTAKVRKDELIKAGASLDEVVGAVERDYLIETLKTNRGNINKTAESAGVNTRTIHRKMKEYDIRKEDFK